MRRTRRHTKIGESLRRNLTKTKNKKNFDYQIPKINRNEAQDLMGKQFCKSCGAKFEKKQSTCKKCGKSLIKIEKKKI